MKPFDFITYLLGLPCDIGWNWQVWLSFFKESTLC